MKRRRWLKRISVALILAWLVGYYLLPASLSVPARLEQPAQVSAEITDRHGQSLRRPLAEGQRVEKVTLSDIPPALIQATVATEDQRFWSHGGIDFLASLRALKQAFQSQHIVSGASTLTQQLVKVAHGRYEQRTWKDKLREMAYARKMELSWPKERILTEYFQRVSYGSQTTGITSAAAFYFQKPLGDLSLAECALLAGLPQAPTRLNPHRNWSAAKKRQAYVLDRMVTLQFITAAQAESAKNEPLRLRQWTGGFLAPHFVEHFLQKKASAESSLPSHVQRTTLDLELQQACERLMKLRLAELKNQQVHEAAVIVLDNRTNGILAMVGSPDFFSSQSGQVNGTLAARSAGSTLKPLTYALALEAGDSPATIVDDLPVEFVTSSGIYEPKNYDQRAYGPMSYREALGNSLNLSAVKVLQRLGGPEKLYRVMLDLGMTTLTQPSESYGLGLTIGNSEVTLFELVQSYACLARLGEWRPSVIAQQDESSTVGNRRIFSPETAWLIADMLSDPQARTRTFGLDSPLRLPFPAAVKTGTSTNFRDNWCVGYTPEFTVGVWMGNFDQQPMQRVSGVTGAAPLWRGIMLWLEQRRGVSWYEPMDTIVPLAVDPLTGLRVPTVWKNVRPSVNEHFVASRLPAIAEADTYDEIGRVRLPMDYRSWLMSDQNWLGSQVVLSAQKIHREAGIESALRIVSPLSGSTYLLDPDLSHEGQLLPLTANHAEPDLEWTSQSLPLESRGGKIYAKMKPGTHTIQLRQTSTGLSTLATITVRAL
jgi:penicillin-binding protein 1C